MVSFNSRISCLNDLSIGDGGILNLPLTLCWSLYVLLSPLVYI
jgi:hypothetical protein